MGPPVVPEVTIGHMRFEAVPMASEHGLGQNGGYIEARDIRTQATRLVKVYETNYDPQREQDVQDVFIVSMKATSDNHLLVTDELHRTYTVDPATLTVTPISR
jgi:hypothetical protein